jgi:hypothetical protein
MIRSTKTDYNALFKEKLKQEEIAQQLEENEGK